MSIGFSGALNHQSLPPLTRAVRQPLPRCHARSSLGRVMTRDGVEQVERGDLDLAFVGLPIEPSPGADPADRPGADRGGPADRPSAGRSIRRSTSSTSPMSSSSSLPLGAGSSTCRRLTAQACIDAGFRPRIAQEITDPFMILTLVSAGVGVALMTSEAAQIMPSAAVLVPLTGEQIYMRHGLAWLEDNPSPVLRVDPRPGRGGTADTGG